MVAVRLQVGPVVVDIPRTRVQGWSLQRYRGGSVARALDGSLLVYSGPVRREWTLSLECTLAEAETLQAWEADGSIVTLTVTEHSATRTYQGALTDLSATYDQQGGLVQVSVTVREG